MITILGNMIVVVLPHSIRNNMYFYDTPAQIKRAIRMLAVMTCIAFLVISGGCEHCASEKEIFRETSQDNMVDAVIIEWNCGGATIGYYYKVYIVPKGWSVKNAIKDLKEGPVFNAHRVSNGDILVKWDKPQLLTVSYVEAYIDHFENYWSSSKVQNYEYEVMVQEHKRDKNIPEEKFGVIPVEEK